MEDFAVDLDKVLDDFEESEGKATFVYYLKQIEWKIFILTLQAIIMCWLITCLQYFRCTS